MKMKLRAEKISISGKMQYVYTQQFMNTNIENFYNLQNLLQFRVHPFNHSNKRKIDGTINHNATEERSYDERQ